MPLVGLLAHSARTAAPFDASNCGRQQQRGLLDIWWWALPSAAGCRAVNACHASAHSWSRPRPTIAPAVMQASRTASRSHFSFFHASKHHYHTLAAAIAVMLLLLGAPLLTGAAAALTPALLSLRQLLLPPPHALLYVLWPRRSTSGHGQRALLTAAANGCCVLHLLLVCSRCGRCWPPLLLAATLRDMCV